MGIFRNRAYSNSELHFKLSVMDGEVEYELCKRLMSTSKKSIYKVLKNTINYNWLLFKSFCRFFRPTRCFQQKIELQKRIKRSESQIRELGVTLTRMARTWGRRPCL